MAAARTRYELRVGTLVSEAALATFRVAVHRTAVRRNTVYKFRIPADRDLSEVLHLLTERDVQVLEIRRCPEPRPRQSRTAPVHPEAPPSESAEVPAAPVGVVLPFPGRSQPRPPGAGASGGRPTG